MKLGGGAFGRAPGSASEVTIVAEFPDGPLSADQAADLALGAALRAYSFDRYKTKKKDGEDTPKQRKLTIGAADADKARKAFASREAVAEGVHDGARPRQRAGQRALSGGIRPPRRCAAQARRQRRDFRQEGADATSR